MRRISLLLLAITCCLAGQGQVVIGLLFGDKLNTPTLEFGLVGGINAATLSDVPGAKVHTGLYLGPYFNYKLNERWVLHPEAMGKCAMGAKGLAPYSVGDALLDSTLRESTVRRDLNYVGLVVLMRYRIWHGLFAEAGPQAMLCLSGKDRFLRETGDDELWYKHDIIDHVARIDAGFAAGFAWKLRKGKSMAISARYYQGLTDVLKPPMAGTQRNSCLQLLVSFPVGAGKSAEQQPPKAP